MKLSLSCLVLASCFAAATCAHASTITSAKVYVGIPDPNDAGDSANTGSNLASANFTISGVGINYYQPSGATTGISGFLNSPTFSNQANGFDPTKPLNTGSGTELIIMGTLTGLNIGANTITLLHDDGAVLLINNVIVTPAGSGGPSSGGQSPFTYTAAGSTATFTLKYDECCSLPAQLDFAVNGVTVGATPEPSSLMLLGTGIAAAAGMVRRRYTRSV